jgi:hypothetical protein
MRNTGIIGILIIGMITILSCTTETLDSKSIAEKEIMGSWDWQKTNYVDTGVIKTADNLGYVRRVVLNGYSWVQYRDNVKDYELAYSIEYSKDLTDDHQHTDYELVLSRSDGHWGFEIKNDSLTLIHLNTGGIIEYVRSK